MKIVIADGSHAADYIIKTFKKRRINSSLKNLVEKALILS